MPGQTTDITWGESSYQCPCGGLLTVTADGLGEQLLREFMFAHRPCSDLVQEIDYDPVPDDPSEFEGSA